MFKKILLVSIIACGGVCVHAMESSNANATELQIYQSKVLFWLFSKTTGIVLEPVLSNDMKVITIHLESNSVGDKETSPCYFLGERWSSKAKFYDAKTHNFLFELGGHKNDVYSARFNRAGTQVVTSSKDKTTKIWNVSTRTCIVTLAGHVDEVFLAEFNGKGDRVVTSSKDTTAKVWDLNGNCLYTLSGHEDPVISAKFNRTGNKVVTTTYNSVKIWDVETGICIASIQDPDYWFSLAEFNDKGDEIVIRVGDNTTSIWSIKELLEIERKLKSL